MKIDFGDFATKLPARACLIETEKDHDGTTSTTKDAEPSAQQEQWNANYL
jgi:hypothetical protein